jgi:hypothetical protein
LTRPRPPGALAARFFAAVILPPLLFFAMGSPSSFQHSSRSLHGPVHDACPMWSKEYANLVMLRITLDPLRCCVGRPRSRVRPPGWR